MNKGNLSKLLYMYMCMGFHSSIYNNYYFFLKKCIKKHGEEKWHLVAKSISASFHKFYDFRVHRPTDMRQTLVIQEFINYIAKY